MTKEDNVVTDFSRRVRQVLGSKLVAIYWFGSRARGEGTVDSDYDLLLETRLAPLERDRDAVADVAVGGHCLIYTTAPRRRLRRDPLGLHLSTLYCGMPS